MMESGNVHGKKSKDGSSEDSIFGNTVPAGVVTKSPSGRYAEVLHGKKRKDRSSEDPIFGNTVPTGLLDKSPSGRHALVHHALNAVTPSSHRKVELGLPRSGYDDEHSPDSEKGPGLKSRRITPSSPDGTTPIKEISLYPSPPSPQTTAPEEASICTPSSTPRPMRKFLPHQSSPTPTPTPSSVNEDNDCSYSWKEGKVHDETHLNLIRRRLFEHETTKEVFDMFQREVRPNLVNLLKQLAETEVEAKYENDLEIADSAYLLTSLLCFPNPQVKNVAKKAGEGSMLMKKGVELMAEARDLLRAAITDILPLSAE